MSDPLKARATPLTSHEAYNAMCHFLDAYNTRLPSDALSELLGSLSVIADGGSADPAQMYDFANAIDVALKFGPMKLELR